MKNLLLLFVALSLVACGGGSSNSSSGAGNVDGSLNGRYLGPQSIGFTTIGNLTSLDGNLIFVVEGVKITLFGGDPMGSANLNDKNEFRIDMQFVRVLETAGRCVFNMEYVGKISINRTIAGGVDGVVNCSNWPKTLVSGSFNASPG